jgi:hypothetical protein
MRAEAGFSRYPSFRLFQQYLRIADMRRERLSVADRREADASPTGENSALLHHAGLRRLVGTSNNAAARIDSREGGMGNGSAATRDRLLRTADGRSAKWSARGPERMCHYVAKAAERIAVKVVVGVIASGSIFTWIIEGNPEARARSNAGRNCSVSSTVSP